MKFEKFTVKPSLKMYAPELVCIALFFILSIYILFFGIPKHGLYIFQIFDVHNQWIRKKIINILRYKIEYSFMCYCMYAIMLILLNTALTFWVKIRFTSYTFTNKYIEIAQGVFNQQKDSIDMTVVKDQELHRTASDMAWGLSRVKIISKDEMQPVLQITGVKHEDADRIFDHLKKYSIRSFADFRLAEVMEKAEDDAKAAAAEDSKAEEDNDVVDKHHSDGGDQN